MTNGVVGPGSKIGAVELGAAAAREGVFAIMRRLEPERIDAIGEALAGAGWRFIEVSMSDADALKGIRRACSAVGSRMWVGAGTVLTKRQAHDALEAGAQFLVSPGLRPEVARLAAKLNVFHLPGVTTATEVASALDLGLTAMKLFPAGLLGPDYIRAMLGPFPHVQFFAVGNVNRGNIAELMRAGARGVGVGSSVLRRTPDGSIDVDATASEATLIMEEVRRGAAWPEVSALIERD